MAFSYVVFIMRTFLLYRLCQNFYNKWMLAFAKCFSASIEMLILFLSFILLIVVSQWLIFRCWTILLSLGCTALHHGLHHGARSFKGIIEFSLLIFCEGFLHLCSSGNFLFLWHPCLLPISWQCLPFIMSSKEIPSSCFYKTWKRTDINSS